LITDALAIEQEDANNSGSVGFMARMLVQVTMPHSKPAEHIYERKNGDFNMTIMAKPSVGLPYGNVPRLLLTWLTTEAIRTKSLELDLGSSMSSFMKSLGMTPTGGKNGSITRFKEQSKRLFSANIQCDYQDDNNYQNANFIIASKMSLWWSMNDSTTTNEITNKNWRSVILLSKDFYDEIITRPVPVDMRALQALRGSSLALDIYTWLTYRNSYLRKRSEIPWELLELQFGSAYKESRFFRNKFIEQLKKVLVVYPKANVDFTDEHLILKPSATHVKKVITKV
jgi:hypothetical protein